MSTKHFCDRCNSLFSPKAWEKVIHPDPDTGYPLTGTESKFNFGDVTRFLVPSDCSCCQSLHVAVRNSRKPISGDVVLTIGHSWKNHRDSDPVRHSGFCREFRLKIASATLNSEKLWPTIENTEDFDSNWTGPRLRLVRPGEVQVGLIRSWISQCDDEHHQSCGKVTLFEDNNVTTMFLDVIEKRLVEKKVKDTEYVALSYVWGRTASLQTNRKNLARFQKPDSMSELNHKIPRTIRETIKLTRDLGLRYLWVDSLCILHDDEETLQRDLQNMAIIYASSCLTVVAALGRHADDGLCPPGSMSQFGHTFEFPRVRLQASTITFEEASFINQSCWATRGWTLQEAFFSRRCIVFSTGITWVCRKVSCHQSAINPSPRPGWGDRLAMDLLEYMCFDLKTLLSVQPSLKWKIILKIFRYYNKRDLSFHTDITRAIAGNLVALKSLTGHDFHYGLPIDIFNVAILWNFQTYRAKRRGPVINNFSSPKHLPSWSWMGWQGQLEPFSWSILTSQEDYNTSLVAWHSDVACFSREQLNQFRPSRAEYKPVCLCRGQPSLYPSPHPLLYFRCLRAFLRYGHGLIKTYFPESKALLSREGADVIGYVDLIKYFGHPTDESGVSGEELELLCISRGRFAANEKEWGRIAISADDPFYNHKYGSQRNKVDYKFYNVLAVRREGENRIAVREGVGRVECSAWDTVQTEMVDVVLG